MPLHAPERGEEVIKGRCHSRIGRWAALAGLAVAIWSFGFPTPEAAARGRRRAVPSLKNQRTERASAPARANRRIPVTVHIATLEGWDIASGRRVGKWVARANEALAPHGIEVYVNEVKRLPAGFTEVQRWRQRRDLAGYAPHDGAVHLFVIESLDLVSPRFSRRRVRGLHWRYRGLNRELRRREYVVVTREAPNTTLAHEIGHLLGLRHSNAEDNIMCSCRKGSVAFTDAQGRQMREGARDFEQRQANARVSKRRWADRYRNRTRRRR